MKVSRISLIMFSGMLWFGIGLFLMIKGLNFIVAAGKQEQVSSGMQTLISLGGGRDEGALILVSLALLVGFFKGRVVLAKTVRRVVGRILALTPPIKFSQVYSKNYYFLIGGMILLGVAMNLFGFPIEWRGSIDVAIGSALINGALIYVRMGLALRQEEIQK